MRSAKEISFRLRQEAGNVWLWARKPGYDAGAIATRPVLPSAPGIFQRLQGTAFADEVCGIAESVLAHRFPLLGTTLDAGATLAWRRDYASGAESDLKYFRRVPYLDPARAGDHKFIWEVNRHQHFVLLAQAYGLTGRRDFLEEIEREWHAWQDSNPYMRGINWTSALEVGFRALSWLWTYDLAGASMDAAFQGRFLTELYRHGHYLEKNLSIYFSPNTHLLGEALALYTLGLLFADTRLGKRWQSIGGEIVEQQMDSQVRPDGSHFEQSSYYHLYTLDMLLFYRTLTEKVPDRFQARLARMAEYLSALMGPSRVLPLLGDDDGGRLFHPYGTRDEFGRATLATCSVAFGGREWLRDPADLHPQALWWLGDQITAPGADAEPAQSRLFLDAGVAIMTAGDTHIVVDAGPMGSGSAGHSHSDALSFVLRIGSEDILVDAGTYTYVGDATWRDWFRGSAAHNTIRIDSLDQADPAGPFRWRNCPKVEILDWKTKPGYDALDAVCRYRGCSHRRRIVYRKPDVIFVLDEVEGLAGQHLVEQFWHMPSGAIELMPGCFGIGGDARLIFADFGEIDHGVGGEHGWRSRVLGRKEAAGFVRMSMRGQLPCRLAAAIDLSGAPGGRRLRSVQQDGQVRLFFEDRPGTCAWFTPREFGLR